MVTVHLYFVGVEHLKFKYPDNRMQANLDKTFFRARLCAEVWNQNTSLQRPEKVRPRHETVNARHNCQRPTSRLQPSEPRKMSCTVKALASASVNCFDHFTRADGCAPGPVLLYSA